MSESSEGKVVSIADQLERRRLARIRKDAEAMHLRELELSFGSFDQAEAIRAADYDAAIAAIDPSSPEEARLHRARLRTMRGLQRLLKGDRDAALAEWGEVIAEVPELADAHLLRGRALMSSDDLPAAMRDYDRAAELEPRNATVYWRRGECLLASGDADRALANYRRAAAIDPKLLDVHHAIGKLLSERGDHAGAIAAYNRAISVGPGYVDLHLGRAKELEAQEDLAGAAADLGRAVALDPRRAGDRLHRVALLCKIGRGEEAIADIQKLRESEPDDALYPGLLGTIHHAAGRYPQAIEELSRAVEMAPDDINAYIVRAKAHAATGDHERSLADHDRAITMRSGDAGLHMGRAVAFAQLGRVPEALEEASRVIELDPTRAFAYVARAVYRDHLEGEAALVDADLDRALELCPGEARYLYKRADIRENRGQYAAALADFDQLAALSPTEGKLFYQRAFCRFRLDEEHYDRDHEWEEDPEVERERMVASVADLEQALALGYREEEVFTELYGVHIHAQDKPAALAALGRGIEAYPESAFLHYIRYTLRRGLKDEEGAAADRARAEALGFQFRDD